MNQAIVANANGYVISVLYRVVKPSACLPSKAAHTHAPPRLSCDAVWWSSPRTAPPWPLVLPAQQWLALSQCLAVKKKKNW